MDYRNYINLEHFPKLFLVVENLSKAGMLSLHKRGDCFVLLQRSEGWGLPHFEAAACGKPIITPSYGGQTEFLKEDNSYLVDYTLCPVGGMNWSPYYRGDQLWCEPDMKQAMDTMLHVYRNREEAREKGLRARAYVEQNFTWDKVGDLIVSRLQEIDQGAKHG
jgi:glycosyltransferase involved in cell wall biosynthesis